MKQALLAEMLESRKDLQRELFIRGFLITNDLSVNHAVFPFYGNWNVEQIGAFALCTHPLTGRHVYSDDSGRAFFLMGHAYDPFSMTIDEEVILKRLSGAYGTDQHLQIINDLTGVFLYGVINGEEIEFLVDPAGMQSACCGKQGDYFYCASHAQLIGDICHLKMTSLVKELISYKWYGRVLGPYLPADLTPFENMKRIVPGILYRYQNMVSHKRFWPLQPQPIATEQRQYDDTIIKAAEILKKNMELISRKWKKTWISLTGGIDSNTTFAAANGIYGRLETFSYISAEKEIRDARAAEQIAAKFNVRHHVFAIPSDDAALEDFELIHEILRHNNSYVAEPLPNEARKRMFLRKNAQCDVEVKSWVSETIRGYWYKYYGRKSMPELSPKLFRNLYKIFIWNRRLAHKLDKVFEKYISEFEYEKIPDCYPPVDMHYNDVAWGSWGGVNISEMKYCFDITFIYNNRRFFDLMFQIPLEKRISDQHHLEIKKYLNRELYDMNIRIVNMKETRFRAFALNVIFTINMLLPF